MNYNFTRVQISTISYLLLRFRTVSLMLFFLTTICYAQDGADGMGDPGDNPEWQMNMGKEAFKVENYRQALPHFNKVIGLLGQTNLEVQYYISKCYYNLNSLDTAAKEIQLFFNQGPDSSYEHFNEMVELRAKVEATIKAEEEDYKRAINSTTIILLDAYIDKHPNGKHIEEIKAKKLTLAEDKAYQRAKNINDIALYREFLNNYPDSKYKAEAEAAIDKLDKENFDKAVEINTEYALQQYINNATDTARQNEAKAKLSLLDEEEEYKKTVKENTIPAYKNYIAQHPDGEHITEVNKLYADRLLTLAKNAEKEGKYDVAADYYKDYLKDFPSAENKVDIENKLAKAERKAKLDEIPRRAYAQYAFDADAEGPANLGICFGSIRARGAGGFLLVRANSHLLETPAYQHSNDSADNDFQYADTKVTNKKRVGRFEFMMGFNRALFEPLWFYGAFGIGLRDVYYQVEETPVGEPTQLQWSKNVDESKLGYLFEVGLTANVLKFVTISAGFSTFNNEEYYPSFGIGFSWKAKDQTR